MPVLKQGAIGPQVRTLQARLKALGFDPKGVDGKFGEDTRAALVAFQISKGLPPDGRADTDTLKALGLNGEPTPPQPVTSVPVAPGIPGGSTSPFPAATVSVVSSRNAEVAIRLRNTIPNR